MDSRKKVKTIGRNMDSRKKVRLSKEIWILGKSKILGKNMDSMKKVKTIGINMDFRKK